MFYLWLKWLHLLALISWMAGILYLIRLYVYHSQYGHESSNHTMLLLMEKRLLRFITRPAMALTWLTGLTMAGLNHQLAGQPWFMLKLICVLGLSFVTEIAGGYYKRLQSREQPPHTLLPSTRRLRWFNELPTLLLALILALILFRPQLG